MQPTSPPLSLRTRGSLTDRLTQGLKTIGTRVAAQSDEEQRAGDELRTRAAHLAAHLRSAGDAPVAIGVDSSPRSITALLGVLLSGRPAVMLDLAQPSDRLHHIVVDSGASTLIGPLRAAADEPELATGLLVVDDEQVLAHAATAPAPNIEPVHDDQVAVIVYTSGSTGNPKGVALSHATVANGARLAGEQFGLTEQDRVALVVPMAFALGLEVVVMALCAGAPLYLHDPRHTGIHALGTRLRQTECTTLHLTPSLLRAITHADPEPLSRIRLFTTAGEPVQGRDVAGARAVLPNADFVNYLGSSETGHLAFFRIASGAPAPDGAVPAGHPADGKLIELLDEDGAPVPAGTSGEMVVTSRHLATGYWRSPELTATRFTTLDNGETRYDTHDRGVIDENGVLRLVGRSDDAIKIGGYQVEPAEVEGALRRIPEIVDAAVVSRGSDSATRLVAYVVPDAKRRMISSASIRNRLRQSLPSWMVPSQIVMLTELPRNERGKLHRAALPEPAERPAPQRARTGWEQAVGVEWAAALGLDAVGPDEQFFELGGDSLAVEEMLQRVHDRLGIRLESGDLTGAPTLREFAALVSRARTRRPRRTRHSTWAQLTAGTPSGTPVFCFAGAGGTTGAFVDLTSRITPTSPVVAFQVNGIENLGIPNWSITGTARRYLRTIQTMLHADQRAVLVGHSLGGLFALEVGRLLTEAGYPRPHVVLLDTVLPPAAVRAQGDQVPAVRLPDGVPQTRRELWRTRRRLLGAGLINYDRPTRDDVFFQHGLRLMDRYRPRAWPGRIDVILTRENIDDRSWWRGMTTDPVTPLELDCDHAGVLRAPYVDRIAELVNDAVETARVH